MKKRAKLKGFTLVELLIVIVVIGVLSAMMMLSSTEAVSSAKAAKVINNLRQLKTAALSWYMDNLDIVDGLGRIKKASDKANNFTGQFAYNNEVTTHKLVPYLGNSGEFKKITTGDFNGTLEDSSGGHYFTDWRNKGQINHDSNNAENAPKEWLILYRVPANDTRLKEKLKARASSLGLINKQPGGNGNKNSKKDDFFSVLVDRFTD